MAIRVCPYYGGKYRMAEKISILTPECESWYELFGGSCAVTLNHCRSPRETVNELNENMYGLLKVMQGDELYAEFMEKLWQLKYSKNEFEKAKRAMENSEEMDDVEKAICTFTRITQSFNNLGKSFSNKGAVNYKYVNVDNARWVHKRLAGVKILNENALEVLKNIETDKKTFILLDPPYRHKYRGKGADKAYGNCEMPDDKHKEMLNIVKDIEADIMICGYRSPNGGEELYDKILRESRNRRWHCYLLTDIHKPNNGGERAKEYIWVNYELPSRAKYYIRIDDKMTY